MKFKREKKARIYGKRNPPISGNFTLSLFDFMWISGLPSPARHPVGEQHICHSHRHLTDRITVV